MNATSEPSIMMDRPVLIPLPNFHLKESLPSDITEFETFRDTECYATEMEQSSPIGVMTTP